MQETPKCSVSNPKCSIRAVAGKHAIPLLLLLPQDLCNKGRRPVEHERENCSIPKWLKSHIQWQTEVLIHKGLNFPYVTDPCNWNEKASHKTVTAIVAWAGWSGFRCNAGLA
ncbi:hypothetical protein KIL84_005173 [Mauremys mutica]|uniref:Uncharacterized protein n=1 Tax=Mauremys mutica TaxID=74926 RepID=A0A9D3XK59_9SAUR|nr:hypothetical protein KIL84_005173 [Mauremys mutica]